MLLAGLLWIVVLALAAAMAILLLGLLFGWPLMVCSVATESQNTFDAMTRAYAYTFQRPLNYLCYIIIAILFGGFCWLAVCWLTNSTLELAYWSTSWGVNVVDGQRMDVLRGTAPTEPGQTSWSFETGQSLIGLWNDLAKSVAAAFLHGLFWCLSATIYLLLRKDADETEMDEIFIADETRTYELPPLKSDEMGIPQVQKPVAVTDPPESADA